MDKTKVAVVEDTEEIRLNLQKNLNLSELFECYHSYSNAEDALEMIEGSEVDVILMDIELPGASGIECTSILKEKFPAIQIIILTVFDDAERIFLALEKGATGYLLKNTPIDKIMQSITEVMNGESPMSGAIARKIVHSFNQKATITQEIRQLTPREKELLDLLAEGYRYKELASMLSISMDTVRSHIRHIYEKLQVSCKVEAINKLRVSK